MNSGVNLFKHKEEALISNHPSLITGHSGRHVTPPPPQPMWADATEGPFSARSPTTTSSLCVNKQQALNSSCTLKNDIYFFFFEAGTQTLTVDRETVFHFRTRFHCGLIEKFPYLHNYLIAHMFSNLSKLRKLQSFSALQNSRWWGPFKRKNIITSSLSLLRP